MSSIEIEDGWSTEARGDPHVAAAHILFRRTGFNGVAIILKSELIAWMIENNAPTKAFVEHAISDIYNTARKGGQRNITQELAAKHYGPAFKQPKCANAALRTLFSRRASEWPHIVNTFYSCAFENYHGDTRRVFELPPDELLTPKLMELSLRTPFKVQPANKYPCILNEGQRRMVFGPKVDELVNDLEGSSYGFFEFMLANVFDSLSFSYLVGYLRYSDVPPCRLLDWVELQLLPDWEAQIKKAGDAILQSRGRRASTPPPSSSPSPSDDVKTWSVKQMKEYLADKGVDASHCVEKKDLVSLCNEVRQRGAAPKPVKASTSSSSSSASAKYKPTTVADSSVAQVAFFLEGLQILGYPNACRPILEGFKGHLRKLHAEIDVTCSTGTQSWFNNFLKSEYESVTNEKVGPGKGPDGLNYPDEFTLIHGCFRKWHSQDVDTFVDSCVAFFEEVVKIYDNGLRQKIEQNIPDWKRNFILSNLHKHNVALAMGKMELDQAWMLNKEQRVRIFGSRIEDAFFPNGRWVFGPYVGFESLVANLMEAYAADFYHHFLVSDGLQKNLIEEVIPSSVAKFAAANSAAKLLGHVGSPYLDVKIALLMKRRENLPADPNFSHIIQMSTTLFEGSSSGTTRQAGATPATPTLSSSSSSAVLTGESSSWSNRQMKEYLSALGVDYRHCLEKQQLVELCIETLKKGGESAEQQRPSSAAGGSSSSAKKCYVCGKTKEELGSKLKNCSGCRSVRYCSSKCQTADWKRHKRECAKLAAQCAGAEK